MAIYNHGWYNANETRDYPLADTAICWSDTNQRLPQDIIADLRLRWPKYLGEYPFISAVTVTDGAVTVLIQCASTLESDNSFTPLAAVTVVKTDLECYRQYPLEAQYPGVFGYIVFGNGINQNYTSKFSSPRQTLICPRAARPYLPLPVHWMRKFCQQTPLTGVILLRGESPIEVVKESREIDSINRDVIVIRLVDDTYHLDDSVFRLFSGPCGKRPESYTCDDPQPIEYINSVGPDCNGVLELNFRGCAIVGHNVNDCSIILDCDLGLAESCLPRRIPNSEGRLPREYDPLYIIPPPISESPTPPVSISTSVIELTDYLNCFDAEENRDEYFVVRSGQFDFMSDIKPSGPCEARGGLCYATTSTGGYNVSIWQGFDTTTLFRQVQTDLKLIQGPAGALHNGGIVINYRQSKQNPERYVYYIAEISYDTKEFRIQRFNGLSLRPIVTVSVPGLELDRWYRLTVQVAPPNFTTVAVTVHLDDLQGTVITIGPVTLKGYYPVNDFFGFGTNRALSRFAYFSLKEWNP